jgi:hypothetical protein
MSASSSRARERLLNAILSRAAVDPAFRTGLLTDPKQTISAAFNLVIPEQFTVRFIEKPPGLDALVVLPDPRPDGEQFDEDELAAVNGGQGDPTFDPDDTPW